MIMRVLSKLRQLTQGTFAPIKNHKIFVLQFKETALEGCDAIGLKS